MFTPETIAALAAKLDKANVTQRTQSGRTLDYIEGWHAIAEANRIFGFDGWHRETVELIAVRPAETVKDKYGKDQWRVGYMAKCKITVGPSHSGVVREGTGFGSGAMGDLGEAIESAIKEAETDAMKRALMTFGNPFGLALYDKSRENVETVPAPKSSAQLKRDGAWETICAEASNELLDAHSPAQLQELWRDYKTKAKADGWPSAWVDALAGLFEDRKAQLEATFPPVNDDIRRHPLNAG